MVPGERASDARSGATQLKPALTKEMEKEQALEEKERALAEKAEMERVLAEKETENAMLRARLALSIGEVHPSQPMGNEICTGAPSDCVIA